MESLALATMADSSIYGHGNVGPYPVAVAEPAFDTGIALVKLIDDLPNRLSTQLYRLNAIRQVAVYGWNPNFVLHSLQVVKKTEGWR